jgi:hypothetical protein
MDQAEITSHMKTLHLLFTSAVTSLFMMAFAARASTEYNFSYSFPVGGTVVTGTLFGDQSGDYVINVTNVTVSGLSSPIRLSRWDGGAFVSLPPIVSFDATNSNFFFGGALPQGGAFWLDGQFRDQANFSPGVGGSTQTLVPQNWSLTPVPEPSGSLLLLLPFGFKAVRRLSKRK